jgi:hypothetical protein
MGGVLRIEHEDNKITENFMLGKTNDNIESKLYGSFKAKFISVKNAEITYKWIQYFPDTRVLNLSKVTDIIALISIIITALGLLFSTVFFIRKYFNTSKRTHLMSAFSQTLWGIAFGFNMIVEFAQSKNNNYYSINGVILNLSLLCSAMSTVCYI